MSYLRQLYFVCTMRFLFVDQRLDSWTPWRIPVSYYDNFTIVRVGSTNLLLDATARAAVDIRAMFMFAAVMLSSIFIICCFPA